MAEDMPEDMPQDNRCPQCARQLPPGSPRGLCPACLLACGMETNTVGYTHQDQADARWMPPEVEELAGIFPELDILELIGRGGMGAVYKAREKQLDRLVALKILPPEIGREGSLAKSFAQRFAHEAQAMAKLSHPNIVTIHSFGSRMIATGGSTEPTAGGDLYFFIMEYVDGLSLRQLLDAGTVNPKEALAIVPQICDALQYAHDKGIVHRDIKPENILLSRAGQVKIADFGLAKLVGLAAGGARAGSPGGGGSPTSRPAVPDITQAGEKVMGTPQYMAPEQINHPRDVDHRADIYSLGVVFYQMLTGELPKGGSGKEFEPPSRKVFIDVRLDEVVLRALEREPSRRYQQVSEVRTRIETIVATGDQAPSDTAGAVGSPKGSVHPAIYGWEYRSKRTLFGLPLLHVVEGPDPATGKPREARGVIAYGAKAKGIVAIGGQATGVIAFGGFAVGIIALGGISLGLLSFGGLAAGLLAAYGGVAVAPFAMGGVAAGFYSNGGLNLGVHRLDARWMVYASIMFYGMMGALGLASIPLKVLGKRSRPQPPGEAGPVTDTDRIKAIEHARQQVKAPAIGLLVAAGVNIAVLFAAIAVLILFVRLDIGVVTPQELAVLLSLGLPFSVLILGGAIWMLNLRYRGFAVVAAILAMIVSPGNLIGLPFGIWALVVLSRREVIEAFEALQPGHPRARRASLVPALRAIMIHAVVFGADLAVLVFVVPSFEAVFHDMGSELSSLTRATIAASHIACEWSFIVFPMFLLLDSGVCLLLQYFAGSRALRWWSAILALMAGAVIATLGLGMGLQYYSRMTQATVRPADASSTTSKASPWCVTLPDGVTVELIGVSVNPSDKAQWWRPDGSPLEVRPYPDGTFGCMMRAFGNHVVREFAFRVDALPWGANTTCTVEKSKPHWTLGGNRPLIIDRIPHAELRACVARIPTGDGSRVPTVRLGVAAGPWRTIVLHKAQEASTQEYEGHKFTFTAVGPSIPGADVTVSFKAMDMDIRTIAIDRKGGQHLPTMSQNNGGDEYMQIWETFDDVSPENVERFEIQARPYQWAEFRNVSLMPGYITRVKCLVVKSPSSGPAKQPATQPVSARPVKLPEHAVWMRAAGDTARSFIAAMREGGKADPYSLTTQQYRQDHAGGLERLVEQMDLSKADPSQYAVAAEAACVVISPISPRNQDMPMAIGLGMIRIGDVYRIRDFDMLPSDEAVKRYLESFRKAYPAARVGFEGQAYFAELMRQKADLENELAENLRKSGPEHPKTLEIQSKIREVQKLLDQLAEATSRRQAAGPPTGSTSSASSPAKSR